MSTFRRLLNLITPVKWWVASGVLLNFLTIASSVSLMALSAYLISKAALIFNVADIAIAITTVRLFAILRAVFRYLERIYTHTATFRILAHLRAWFYASLEPAAPARLMQYRSGDLLARIIGDIETLDNFYVRVVVPPVAAVLVTIFTCIILRSFNITLATALLVFLVLTGVVLPFITRWISRQPATALITTRAELDALLVDEVQGAADLLTFDLSGQHQARVAALSRALDRTQERIAMLRGVSNALIALLTSLAGLTVLMLGTSLVGSGKMEGVYLALLPLTAIASFEAVQPLSQAQQQLEASRSAGRRLFELIDAQPEVIDPVHGSPQPVEYGIDIRNLTFGYPSGGPPVLDGVSMTIPPCGRAAIVGPSGSGKSTLVNLLLRFWEFKEGTIAIGGHDVRSYRADDVRQMIGVVPQQIHLFNTTIRDNLLLANPDATDEQIEWACRQAQIHDFIETLPDGYDTIIGENGLLLSGGERQRLAIARVILKNAPILILDEATANLDALTEQKLIQSLGQFMDGRTVLMISHGPISLPGVDQIFHLDNGHVLRQAG